MRRLGLYTLGFLLVAALGGCATVSPACQQEIDACLKRCEATGGRDVKKEQLSPEFSTTWCEDRCGNCREPKSAPAPAPSPPPTYTGTAK